MCNSEQITLRDNRLPPEIINVIIDFLHDDIITLRACSLVSLTWVEPSRHHLFSRVTLGGPLDTHPKVKCDRLHRVLLATPAISSYITELVIYEALSHPCSEYQSLPPLLRGLTRLRRLEFLSYPGYIVSAVHWTKDLLTGINTALSSSSHVHDLRLRGLIFSHPIDVLYMIQSCPRLEVLHLDDIGFPASANHTALSSIFERAEWVDNPAEKNTKLKSLSIDRPIIIGCLLHPQSPVDLSGILHLSLKICDSQFPSAAELLRFAPSLEHLEFEVLTFVDSQQHQHLDLSYNPALRSLGLQAGLLLDRFDPLPWLHNLLSTIQPGNCLEELSLLVVIDLPPPYLTLSVYQASLNGWKAIDSLLTQPKFASLNRIRLDFALDNPIDDEIVPSIMNDVLLQLIALDRKGILFVDACEIR